MVENNNCQYPMLFDKEVILKNLEEPLRSFAEVASNIVNNIDWDSLRRSLEIFANIISNIPDEVKNTKFFHEVEKIANFKEYELTYENIEWFVENIRNEVLIETKESSAGIDDNIEITDNKTQTALTKYIYQVEDNPILSVREKAVILLAHMEPLIFETLNHEKVPRERLKNVVHNIAVENNSGISAESLAKIYVYGIQAIVFAPTDFFQYSIDKRIPFRNNILHNGVVSYSDEELETVYEVLSVFVDALVIMKHWIPSEDAVDN